MIAGGRRHIVYGSRSDQIKLWSFADLHYGNRGVAMDRLKDDIQEVADDPHSFWIGVGDYAECISPQDPRFDPQIVSPNITVSDLGEIGRKLLGDLLVMFDPIKHKCVGLGDGNHEDKYMSYANQQNLMHWFSVEMGAPYFGYSCLFDLVFVRTGVKTPRLLPVGEVPKKGRGSWAVRIYTHHGCGAPRSRGAKLNRLLEFMGRFDAEVTFMAHVHDQTAKRSVRIRGNDACDDVTEYDQLGVITGAYLRTYALGPAGYGEKKGYDPVPLGAVPVAFTPDKHKFHAEV